MTMLQLLVVPDEERKMKRERDCELRGDIFHVHRKRTTKIKETAAATERKKQRDKERGRERETERDRDRKR